MKDPRDVNPYSTERLRSVLKDRKAKAKQLKILRMLKDKYKQG